MTKVSELREENLNRVRTCFSSISIWTKNELIAATGISSGGMVSILQELKERKEILQEEDAASTGGRPGHQYRLNPDAYHACCVFLKAGTEARMECFSMDLYGKRQQEKAYVISDTASVLSNIKQMLAADSSMKEILISVPGVSEEGKIRECDISFLSGCDLKQKIIAETGLVPVMENDVNIAAIGLQRKTQKTDLAYIYQPDTAFSGVGIVIGGKLYNGASHMAGEVRYLDEEKRQLKRVKTEPEKLLAEQMEVLNAVLNPALIGWDSSCFETDVPVHFRMPDKDQPQVVRADLNEMMYAGMHGMMLYRYSGKEER